MVYKDGSVLVSHGGTEMGQGLHTKMIQIASQVLSDIFKVENYKIWLILSHGMKRLCLNGWGIE